MGLSTRRKLTTALILTLLILAFALASAAPASAQGQSQGHDKQTLIIKVARGVSQAEGQALARRHGGTPKSSIAQLGMIVVEVPAAAVEGFTKSLQGEVSVERVEENHTRKLSATPSDSQYENQWALPKIAWDQVYGTAMPIGFADVAILDTGIDAAHPDLVGAIGPGTSMIDGSEGRTDSNGHGTWVAGIVAGRTNNLDGIAGVAYSNVQVLPVKVLDADGLGQDSDIIAGILWAVDHHASVILMAFSNPGFSANLQDAVDYAWSQGVVLVAAAGNDAVNTATFPAGDKNVVGVSATDQNDVLATTSNFGPSIFMAAPGVDILSTYKNGGYVAWSGTSASAAMVAGAAAFMRAADPSLTNGAVVGRLARNADPAGTQDETGNGRLQLARALTDTVTDEVQPLGAPPVGDGGPFVGPYRAAAANLNLSPSSGPSGTLVTVTASGGGNNGGFDKDKAITFTFNGNPISTGGSCVTNNGGNLNSGCTFVVPALASGTYTVVGSDGTNTISASFTIAGKLSQTITFGALANKTYGDADFVVSATASSGLSVAFSSTTLSVCTVSGATVHIATVGTCTVLASQVGDASYDPAPDVDQSFSVAQKPASVSPAAASKTYGDSDPSLTGTLSGFLPGDGVTAAYSRTIGETVPGSPYTVSATLSPGAVLSNYNITYNTAAFTINPASSTTTVSCPASVTYDGSAQTPCTLSVTGAGGLSLTPTPSYLNNINAGNATASYTYAGDANHNGSNDSENFTIDAASSTTTITCPASVTYDGSAQTPCTVSVTGASGLNLSPVASYSDNTNAGIATASYTFAGDANHTGSSDSENFTIDLATSTTTVTCPSNVTYDGSAQTPCTVSVTGAGGLNLSPAASYSGNINAGIATASYTFAGDANHTGSSDSENFTIDPASSSTTITCPASVTYDGSAQTPCTVSVTGAGGLNLSPAASYSDNINAGIATASHTYPGDANHTGSSDSENFTIDPASSSTTITCPASVTYDGSAQTPCTMSVTGAGGLSLTPAPSYLNNINAGTATASYTYAGDANHSGSSDSENFTIDPATSTTTITCPSNVTYDGSAQTPCTVSLTGAGGLNLTPAPSYLNNVNAGTATASYTYAGDANHSGSSDSKNFTIDLATSTTTVTCPSNITYDGSAQTPCSVTVIGAGGLNLSPAPSYSDNINAGIATASHTYAGDANHSGSSDSKNFTIDLASSTTVVSCPANVTYDGLAQTPCTVNVTGAGGLNLSPAPSYSNNVNAGIATASYTYAGDANHSGSIDSKNFTIDLATSTTTVTCPSNVTYDGSAHAPCTVNVTGAGGLNLTPAPSYLNNINAGTATASYTYAGDANHSGSIDSKNFTIDLATSTTTVTCPSNVTYDGSAHAPCTVNVTGAGGLNLTPAPSYLNNVNAGIAAASYTYAGDANHSGSSDSKNFTIDLASSTTTVSCPANVTYNGSAQTPCTVSVTGAGGLSLNPTPSYLNNVNAGTATASYTYAGDANHNGSSDSKNFIILQASLTITANDKNKLYDGTPYSPFTVSYDGFVGGQDPSVLGGSLNFTGSAAGAVTAGTYTIRPEGLTSGNYQIAFVDGTLQIHKVALTITSDNKARVFGEANPAFTATITGFVNSETASVVSGSASFSGTGPSSTGTTGPGAYVITPSKGTLTATNYTFDTPGAVYVDGTLTISKADTTTTVTSSANPSVFGETVTFTAEVTPVAPGSGTRTGTVQFKIDGVNAGAPVALALNGKATYSTSSLIVGHHVVDAEYSGDANFNPSARTFDGQDVNKANTTTTVTSSLNPSTYGTMVTFTVEVKPVGPGSGIPTGTVGLSIDGSPIAGVFTLDAAGKTTYQTSALTVPASPHSVQVTYPGSDSFNPSSGIFAQTVVPLATNITVSGPATVVYSDSITLSATVGASLGNITGQVEFFIGSTSYGTVNLAGVGSVQTVTKTVAVTNNIGSYTVKAVYIPDFLSNHAGSEGTYSTLTVKPENSFGNGPTGAYTGQNSAWTPTATSNTATLTLGATIFDDPDLNYGDIRTAKVSFGLRDGSGKITPITGATNLAVGLVTPGDLKVGTSAVTLQFSLNSSDICQVYTVAVLVSGNYSISTAPWNDTHVTICRAAPGTILTNPTAVVSNAGSSGMIAPDGAGAAASETATSTVDFDVKYNKSGTNQQGKVYLAVHSNRNSNGVVEPNSHHVYYITSTAISTLSVNGSKADFSAKANVVELIMDGSGNVLSAVSLDSGAIMQLSIDASKQTIGIQINMSKGKGGVWYSSLWNGATTVTKTISGGTIKVTAAP